MITDGYIVKERHFWRNILNFYCYREKRWLELELIVFVWKNYYLQWSLRFNYAWKELFIFDFSGHYFRIGLLGLTVWLINQSVDIVGKDEYFWDDEYMQFHLRSGAWKIADSDQSNNPYPMSCDNRKSLSFFDYVYISFGKTEPEVQKWIGCHLEVNIRQKYPFIQLTLSLLRYEFELLMNKRMVHGRNKI